MYTMQVKHFFGVSAHPDKDWDYSGVAWDIVSANPDKAWNYDWLSVNPNITWVLSLQKGKVFAKQLTCTISLAIHLFHSYCVLLLDC
jgi:hypothetical protein